MSIAKAIYDTIEQYPNQLRDIRRVSKNGNSAWYECSDGSRIRVRKDLMSFYGGMYSYDIAYKNSKDGDIVYEKRLRFDFFKLTA